MPKKPRSPHRSLRPGPGSRRPVLVVQVNSFTESHITIVIVAVMTSNLALAEAPGNVRISKSEAGLPQPSVVNVSQLITVDKTILTSRVNGLPSAVMQRVEAGQNPPRPPFEKGGRQRPVRYNLFKKSL